MDQLQAAQLVLLITQLQLQRRIIQLIEMEIRVMELEMEIEELNRPAPRRFWVKRWIKERDTLEPHISLFRDLQVEDNEEFKSYIRMDMATFNELVRRVGPRIQKKHTTFREPISVVQRLLLTLSYLAEGGMYRCKKFLSRTPHNTMSKIVKETCDAIYNEYEDEYLHCPTTPPEWLQVAERFQTRWQFPHTLGALEGKHVAKKCPKNSGSRFYNYKGFYSIVIMALVDADYKFIWIEVGSNGRSSDAQIFNDCDLSEAIINNTIGIPADDHLPGDERQIPYYIVGDDAFSLKTWLMKPFSQRCLTKEQRIFNYRISRARRIVENAFGMLANRFGCLLNTFRQTPENVSSIVKCCIILHNILRSQKPLAPGIVDEENENHDVRPGYWRRFQVMHDMEELERGNIGTRRARQQRQYLAHYLCSPVGSVPWQDEYIERHRLENQ